MCSYFPRASMPVAMTAAPAMAGVLPALAYLRKTSHYNISYFCTSATPSWALQCFVQMALSICGPTEQIYSKQMYSKRH
jgi:hypothetical protein